ncbi:MAG: SH3 domain-containing protein [Planctomycetota bacterium]|jgi:uncharacterized protein YraI
MQPLRISLICRTVTVIAACLLSTAAGQTQPEGTSSEPGRPFTAGLLTGDNVYVRQGPGREYPAYYTAPMNTEVKAVGRKGDWLEIEFPAKGFSWIIKDYLSKIDEETGLVTGNEVNIRGGPGVQFDELYRVQANHKFKILGVDITGKWYRVAPMPDATAWISKDYVRLSGPLPGERAPTPAPEVTPSPEPAPPPTTPTPAPPEPKPEPGVYEKKMAEADEAMKAELAKEDPAEWDIDRLREMFKDIEDNSDDAVLRLQARTKTAHLNAYATVKQHAIKLSKIDEALQEELKELERVRQEEAAAVARTVSPYLARGTLDKFYIKRYGDATHKLTDDNGAILYLLRTEVADLTACEGKICGVKGRIITVPGVKVQIIEVTEAAVISTPGA